MLNYAKKNEIILNRNRIKSNQNLLIKLNEKK